MLAFFFFCVAPVLARTTSPTRQTIATAPPRTGSTDPVPTRPSVVPGVTVPGTEYYIYTVNAWNEKCTSASLIDTLAECKTASDFFNLIPDVTPRQLGNSPFGCYWYESSSRGSELHFNGNTNGAVATDSLPVCKIYGTTTTIIRQTRPPRTNPDCSNEMLRSDGFCDAGNNNAGCNWDKSDKDGAVSDCCLGASAMTICKDPALCQCLDKEFITPPPDTTGRLRPNTTIKTTSTTDGTVAVGASSTTTTVSTVDPKSQTTIAKTTTTTISTLGCHKFTQGDGHCDPGNNNAGCDYDKKAGKQSDCCAGDVSKCTGSKCSCLDPNYRVSSAGLVPTPNLVLWMFVIVWCGFVFAA